MNQSLNFKTEISNTGLRKLGKKLRTQDFEDSCLEDLELHRRSFREAGAETFTKLLGLAQTVHTNTICTYRIKRINSIIGKLVRIPGRQLDKMWDIVGCRCVLKSEENVYRLRDLILENFKVVEKYDYYDKPKEGGYKSIHLYVESPSNPAKKVEIQLRAESEHNWATLVEIIDTVYDTSIKESAKRKSKEQVELEEFLQIISSSRKLSFDQRRRVLDLVHKYNLYSRLRELFIRNYYDVRKQYAQIGPAKNKYYLIETDDVENKPTLANFQDLSDAEDEYFNRYITQENKNFVLINISNPSLENLEKAYSNYILTRHTIIDYYFNTVGQVFVESIGTSTKLTVRYYDLYLSIIKSLNDDFADEEKMIQQAELGDYDKKKVKYWRKEFKKRFGERRSKVIEINKSMNQAYMSLGSNKERYRRALNKVQAKYGQDLIPEGQ